MSMQLNIDAPWISPYPATVSVNSSSYGNVTSTSISSNTNSYSLLENRIHTLEKILVDILKDYPELILKYPDLVKSVRD